MIRLFLRLVLPVLLVVGSIMASIGTVAFRVANAAPVLAALPSPDSAERATRGRTLDAVARLLGQAPLLERDQVEVRRKDEWRGRNLWIRCAGTTEIAAPMSRIAEIVTDFERYPQFLKNTSGSPVMASTQIHGGITPRADVTFEVAVPWFVRAVGVPNGRFRLLTWAPEEPPGEEAWSMTWSYISGNVGETLGAWHLVPISPDRVLATYYFELDMGPDEQSMRRWFPDLYQRASNYMMARAMVGTLSSVRREAQGAAPVHVEQAQNYRRQGR